MKSLRKKPKQTLCFFYRVTAKIYDIQIVKMRPARGANSSAARYLAGGRGNGLFPSRVP